VETLSFRCPHCSQGLKVSSDKAGCRFKCPKCGFLVTVAGDRAAPQKPPEKPTADDEGARGEATRSLRKSTENAKAAKDDSDEEQVEKTKNADDTSLKSKRRGKKKRAKWKQVHLGLVLILVALLGSTGTTILVNVLSKFLPLQTSLSLWRSSLWMDLGLAIVGLAGYGFCLSVPVGNRARQLAIAALASYPFNAGVSVAVNFYADFQFRSLDQQLSQNQVVLPKLVTPPARPALKGGGKGVSDEEMRKQIEEMRKATEENLETLRRWPLWTFLIQILTFAHTLITPFFLRAIALNVYADRAVQSCMYYFYLSAAVVLWSLVVNVIIGLIMGGHWGLVGLMTGPWACVGGLINLAYTIWQILIVIEIRSAVAAYVAGRSEEM